MGDPAFINPLEGLNVGYVIPGSYLYQDLGLVLQTNTDYALSYAVGRRYDSLGSNYRMVVTAGGGPYIEGQNMWTYSANSSTIGVGTWTVANLNFSTGSSSVAAGRPLRVWLANDGGGLSITTSGFATQEVVFDLASVPEPATFVLVGVGIAGIFFIRRRIA